MNTPIQRLPRSMLALCFAVAGLANGAATAHAASVYDNLASSQDGADPVFSYGPLADSFSTGAAGGTLASVQLLLTSLSAAYPGSLLVLLLADAAASPGAVLTTLGALSFTDVATSTVSAYTVTPASGVALNPDTRYWVELVGLAPNAIQWSWSDDTAALGVAGEYSYSTEFGVSANAAAGAYQMGVVLSSVPEPRPLALFALALAAVAMVHIARRQD